MDDGDGAERTPGAGALPRDTTPTWEMELLLSGATVFGLVQLPRELDAIFFDALGRLQEEAGTIVMTLWIYAQASLFIVILTFVAHLMLRGYWIALVGLGSVYPAGIRWDKLRIGPHLRAISEAVSPPMAARVEAADNRATRVFGVGMGLAFSILVPAAMVVVSLVVYLVVAGLSGSPRHGLTAFWIFFAIGFAPFLALYLLDRAVGRRLDPAGRPGRWLRGALRLYVRFGVARASNPLLAIFQSNDGARRTGVLVFLGILLSVGLALARFAAQEGGGWGSFPGLPPDDPRTADTVLAEHYATTRGRAPSPAWLPYVQDRVIRGPYLELFVPYNQRRHPRALAAACPAAVAAAEAGGSARAALDCLAVILDVRLDGAAQPVILDGSTDAVTGQRGVLAMIRVDHLPPGRHELTLRSPPRRDLAPGEAPLQPYRIPFWR